MPSWHIFSLLLCWLLVAHSIRLRMFSISHQITCFYFRSNRRIKGNKHIYWQICFRTFQQLNIFFYDNHLPQELFSNPLIKEKVKRVVGIQRAQIVDELVWVPPPIGDELLQSRQVRLYSLSRYLVCGTCHTARVYGFQHVVKRHYSSPSFCSSARTESRYFSLSSPNLA